MLARYPTVGNHASCCPLADGLLDERILFVPGNFNVTLSRPPASNRRYALLHIDADACQAERLDAMRRPAQLLPPPKPT